MCHHQGIFITHKLLNKITLLIQKRLNTLKIFILFYIFACNLCVQNNGLVVTSYTNSQNKAELLSFM